MKISVDEAKSRFSEILDRLVIGDEVILAEGGEPIAKLVPIRNPANKRRALEFDSARGEFSVPDYFNNPLPKGSKIYSMSNRIPQGLKPARCERPLSARLKSCPSRRVKAKS